MYTYSVNIARLDRCTSTQHAAHYTHWGRVELNDADNEFEARTKFDRLAAAFPAPEFHLMLSQYPLRSSKTLATSPSL